MIALWAQPLINTYGASRGVNSWVLIIGLVTFSFFFISSIINASKPEEFKTVKGENCHLVWSRTEDGEEKFIGEGGFLSNFPPATFIYLAGLFIPLLFIKPLSRGIKLSLIGAIALAVARLASSKKEFSSWFCWIAGIFTLSAILITQ